MMTKFIIQWQDQFGKWHRLQEKHNAADAFRTAQQRVRSTGKRHRLVDESGALLDIVNPLDAVVDAIAHTNVKPPRLTKQGFVARGAAVTARKDDVSAADQAAMANVAG